MPQFTGYGNKQENALKVHTLAADIFAPSTLEGSTIRARTVAFKPISIQDGGPNDFRIPAEGNLYLNGSSARLYHRSKVVKVVNGEEVNDEVAVVNDFSYALFNTEDSDFQGQLVSQVTTPNHHYKAHLENLLSYNKAVQDTHLRTVVWHQDTPNHYNDANDDNKGWVKRKNLIANSKEFEGCIDLHEDILANDRFLPDQLNIGIRFTRAPDSFALHAKRVKTGASAAEITAGTKKEYKEIPEYRIKILELILYIDKIEMSPATLSNHAKHFSEGKVARYPYARTEIRTKQIPKGETYAKFDHLFMNELPNMCLIVLVNSEAYNGAIHENPFYFRHYNLNYFAFKINSEEVPLGGYRPKFTAANPLVMREYRALFDNTGVKSGNITNCIFFI